RRSLFELALGQGHAWFIDQTFRVRPSEVELFGAVLPAWEAMNRFDLGSSSDLGFDDALATVEGMVSSEWPTSGSAAQVARACSPAPGFRAAAISAIGVRALSAHRDPPDAVPVREAWLRFDRPYAVVAVALADGTADSVPREAWPWHGVPVFSAWVAE